MESSDTHSDLKPNKWRGRLILSLRWVGGGFVGVVISSWFYFGFITHANTGSYLWLGEILSSMVALPFAGHAYLFFPYKVSLQNIIELFVTPPAMIWGFISALLASGQKGQIKIGTVLLVIYIIVGCISYIQVFLQIPT